MNIVILAGIFLAVAGATYLVLAIAHYLLEGMVFQHDTRIGAGIILGGVAAVISAVLL